MSKMYLINPSVFHEKIARYLEETNDESLKSLLIEYKEKQEEINEACRERDILEMRIMGKVGMTLDDFVSKLESYGKRRKTQT